MSLSIISRAEDKYLAILEDICGNFFSGVNIPSHDNFHHARVWKYAKEIITSLEKSGMIKDQLLAEKSIIAVWFHDTGLTINKGPDHGRESRKICSEFLEAYHVPSECRTDILEAVEKHDDKEYSYVSDPASVASIVSVADDMDAFGFIGILRYYEIYSMRNIPMNEMPEKIIANAQSRFNHISSTYNMFPDLVRNEEERLETLLSFYRSLKNEIQVI